MRTYTKREMAYILKVSPSTIAEDAKHLNLKPTKGDRQSNLYSESDYRLISQLREHCADKTKSRESFVPSATVEIIDHPEPDILAKYEPKTTTISIFQEALDNYLIQHPLADLKILQEVSDHNWLLPTNRLAALIGLSKKYLNRRKNYIYCGFLCSVETYAEGRALWKITANNS